MEEGTSTSDQGLSAPEDLVKYTQDVFKAVVAATRSAKALPKLGEDYELYNSYPVFAELMKAEGDRVLQLITKLCKHSGAKTHLMDNTLLMEERMERLSEVNDFLLERVGNLLDEAAGLRRPEELVVVGPDSRAPLARTIATSWNRVLHTRSSAPGNSGDANSQPNQQGNEQPTQKKQYRLLGSYNVARPQVHFSELIDNSNRPFVPKLRFKHNAKERRHREGMRIVDDEPTATSAMETDMQASNHPYKYELEHFEPETWQFEYPSQIMDPKPVEETPLIYVRTEDQLKDLCRILKSVREFAVDLEHHSYRSFQGLTCLIQISTRTHDYIVDPLVLWRQMHILNDPFTDPSIMKVFHAASMDVLWLQRDFGIYVVNMFDTGQAVRQLNFPRLSLAYLVQHYCGEELAKEYQMADWRIRPLTDEMLMYARKDTHYLLTCCDRLRQELLDKGNEQKNLLRAVFSSSRDVCLRVYQKPMHEPDDHMALLAKSRKRFNNRQLYALKELYAWRDNLARVEDESLHYILPDHMLLQIAEVLPREIQGIWACCSPVPTLLRQDSHTLHRMILHARALPLETKQGQASQANKGATQASGFGVVSDAPPLNELRSSMLRSHDFTHSSAEEEIVPLSHRLSAISNPIRVKEPSLTLFDFLLAGEEDGQATSKKRKLTTADLLTGTRKAWEELLTPYDQYLLAMAAASEAASEKESDENLSAKPKKRKMYSHLDQPVNRPQKQPGPFTEEEASTSKQDSFASPPTKKKRMAVASAEETHLEEIISSKKLKKRKKKLKPDVELVQSYDYSSADKSVFAKGATTPKADIFEPNKEFLNKRDKKNKKKGAKKGMTGTLSGGWKKKSAAAFSSFDSGGGGAGHGRKKGGKW